MRKRHRNLVADRELQIKLSVLDNASAGVKSFGSSIGNIQDKVEGMMPTFKKISVAGAAVFAGLSLVVKGALDEFADSQKKAVIATQALQNAFDNLTKSQVGNLKKELGTSTVAFTQITDAMQKSGAAALQLGFDDDAARLAFAKLFQVSKSVTQAQEDMKLAMDLAAFSGRDLESSAAAITKVHTGATRILKEFGFEVDKDITPMEALALLQERTTGTAGKLSKTMEGQTRIMKENFANLKEGIGKALAPAFAKLITVITPLIEKFANWAEKNPKLIATIVAVVGAMSALAAIIAPIMLLFVALSGPVIAIIAVVGLLAGAAVLVIMNWSKIKDFFINLWVSVTQAFSSAIDFIKGLFDGLANFFTGVWEVIKTIFSFAASFLVGLVLAIFNMFGIDLIAIFNKITEFFPIFWNNLKTGFQVALNWISNLWRTVWTAITDFLSPVTDAITAVVTVIWTTITAIFNKFSGPLKSIWESLWNGLGNIVGGVWEGIKNTVKASINWIIEKINKLITSINSVTQKGASVLHLSAPQIPKIPMLAKGGIVNKPTVAMIGEAGPEAVVPLSKMNGMGGGINITITGNSFMGDDRAAEKLGDQIIKILKANMRLT